MKQNKTISLGGTSITKGFCDPVRFRFFFGPDVTAGHGPCLQIPKNCHQPKPPNPPNSGHLRFIKVLHRRTRLGFVLCLGVFGNIRSLPLGGLGWQKWDLKILNLRDGNLRYPSPRNSRGPLWSGTINHWGGYLRLPWFQESRIVEVKNPMIPHVFFGPKDLWEKYSVGKEF